MAALVARRRGGGGSPRAPSASPSGTSTTRVGGRAASTGSGSSEPARPVGLALPGGPPEVGERQHHVAVGQGRAFRLGHGGREGRQQRVLVLLRRPRSASTTPGRRQRAQRVEPVAPGERPAVAEDRPLHRRHPPADRGRCRPDVEDGLRREPEGCQPRGQGTRRRPGPVQQQSGDALQPLADPGELDRGRGNGRRELDDEDSG